MQFPAPLGVALPSRCLQLPRFDGGALPLVGAAVLFEAEGDHVVAGAELDADADLEGAGGGGGVVDAAEAVGG
ncbi:hypothetical protein GCM10020229_15150 [Kitasatospora albolonga]